MTKTAQPSPRRGGRPSKEQAGEIEEKILDAATALFFREGYGNVSIESICMRARISKRTFYVRYKDKAELFGAVVRRIIRHVRPSDMDTEKLFTGDKLEQILRRVGLVMLRASLSDEGLSLYRIIMSEAKRFPELAIIVDQQGARREAIRQIAKVLENDARKNKHPLPNAEFLSEQFLLMITAAPQRRALGLGMPMSDAEITAWANNTVDLFLRGYMPRQ